MDCILIGMDISKYYFQVFGRCRGGKIVLNKRLYRSEVKEFYANLQRSVVGMEACAGAHYWARELRALGHEVKLMSPQFVKPYVKSNKSDRADAEAICEAASRPGMRFVGVKSIEQQDVLNLHRVRERLIKTRTALANEIRGLLLEYGVIIPKGIKHIRYELGEVLVKNADKLTAMSQETFYELLEEFHKVDERVSLYDEKLSKISKAHPICNRLMTIPGIGEIAASALVAMVGDPSVFKNGRQFSAWLGLVPRQHSTGGKERLLGISKRGDKYTRKLLVHGARSVLIRSHLHRDKRSCWTRGLKARRGMNKATVALANKNARVAWKLLTKPTIFYKEYQIN